VATVRYMVTNVDEAVQFYTERLGFSLVERWGPAFAVVAREDLSLWISGPDTSAARPMPDGRLPVPGVWNRVVLEVGDIQTLVKSLQEAGVAFRNHIITGPGGSQVLVEDPSGNPIEIFQSVGEADAA
jgi:catechol 2,3-dioxygenase-like lactoylglutathione lyase family enzyme